MVSSNLVGDQSFRTYTRAIGRLPATANFTSKKQSRLPKVVADLTYGVENLGKVGKLEELTE
jgi:hypothetical protein